MGPPKNKWVGNIQALKFSEEEDNSLSSSDYLHPSWVEYGALKSKKVFVDKKESKYCFGGKLLCRPKDFSRKSSGIGDCVGNGVSCFPAAFCQTIRSSTLFFVALSALIYKMLNYALYSSVCSVVNCTLLYSALFYTMHSFVLCTLFHLHSITLWTLLHSVFYCTLHSIALCTLLHSVVCTLLHFAVYTLLHSVLISLCTRSLLKLCTLLHSVFYCTMHSFAQCTLKRSN